MNCFPSATCDSDCVGGSTPSGTQGVNCVGTSGQVTAPAARSAFLPPANGWNLSMHAILQLTRRRVRRGPHLHGIRHEALRRAERGPLLRGARGLALRLSESFASGRSRTSFATPRSASADLPLARIRRCWSNSRTRLGRPPPEPGLRDRNVRPPDLRTGPSAQLRWR